MLPTSLSPPSQRLRSTILDVLGVIPLPGGQPTSPPPEFTTRAPVVPPGGVTLEEVYNQGKTDVVR